MGAFSLIVVINLLNRVPTDLERVDLDERSATAARTKQETIILSTVTELTDIKTLIPRATLMDITSTLDLAESFTALWVAQQTKVATIVFTKTNLGIDLTSPPQRNKRFKLSAEMLYSVKLLK